MNFGKACLLVFALVNLVNAEGDDRTSNLRGLATSRDKKTWYTNSYNEKLGDCRGAVCGLWGDPHILSCDGLGYDCNAHGLFTVMKNFLYNIQARFIHVNSVEMGKVLGWENFPAATYTTDIMIDNLFDDDAPLMQFSFPEFITENGLPPEETGCLVGFIYEPTLEGYAMTSDVNITECRQRCAEVEECKKFYWLENSHCHLVGSNGQIKEQPSTYSRSVAGTVDRCGIPGVWEAREGTEIEKAKVIGNGSGNKKKKKYNGAGCPILYYQDGELQDLSEIEEEYFYFYGDENSVTYAKLVSRNKIKVRTLVDGEISEIMLETAGDGPGELFGCHWNLFVCLPKNKKSEFEVGGLGQGLFGSPDETPSNDWMTTDGTLVGLPDRTDKGYGTRGQEAFDYCTSNWCVSQDESLMVPPAGGSFADVKCQEEEYKSYDVEACFLDSDAIKSACSEIALEEPSLLADCEMECCRTGCKFINETAHEIEGLVTLSTEPDNNSLGLRTDSETASCNGDGYEATGDSACPSASGSIVKVIHETAAIPDGEPIIYGISFLDSQTDNHGREVSFRIQNPFPTMADAFVRYEKKVGQYANDPACEKLLDTDPGCLAEAPEIRVGCIEYPGREPFAVVDVYFASEDISGDGETEVEKCCSPPEYSGVGVIKYSFKIQCGCPDDQAS